MKRTYSSHDNFVHDSLDSLGYDWERVANPAIQPKFPFKLYLPRTTEHVVAAVLEARQLGQSLRVRSKGHSSNDLVLADGGVVLCTEKLNQILGLDEVNLTVTIQSGAVLAEVDAYLGEKGFGLPIIGDHNHITAGGFASVGGISPASHRFGMFVDNVVSLRFVDWSGEVRACGAGDPAFPKVLAGTGQHGVITEITCRVMRVDKVRTIVRNSRQIYLRLESFIEHSNRLVSDPGDSLFERGVWVDYPVASAHLRVGQFSSYRATPQSLYARLRRSLAYGYLHALGRVAGRLPRRVDLVVKFLGMIGIIFSPRFGTINDVECFTDKVLDSSVGDPTRMLVVLAPTAKYVELFRAMHQLCLEVRESYGAITFVSFYVKAIRSEYLSSVSGEKQFAELMLYLGVDPAKMTNTVLDGLVSRIDQMCMASGAFRYMHSKTSKNENVLNKVDSNRARALLG